MEKCHGINVNEIKFKFQYGATNIRYYIVGIEKYIEFKFQYGATNI